MELQQRGGRGARDRSIRPLMKKMMIIIIIIAQVLAFLPLLIRAQAGFELLTWNVSYQSLTILGSTPKKVITINGQFPGPEISSVTNDNLVINVFNSLDEPLLITWNGIWQRRTSWQDGVSGSSCGIKPGRNFSYSFQVKDQIGSYFYFPSTDFLKAAGGYGSFKVESRSIIPLPYPAPHADLVVLLSDWFNADHAALRAKLDAGGKLGPADGVLINGRGPYGSVMSVEAGRTYRLRVSNVGIAASLNFRIQGHRMQVVETEGSHTVQNEYDDLDIHVGQSYSLLVAMSSRDPGDFYVVASTRFTSRVLSGVAILRYVGSSRRLSGPLPPGPTTDIASSLNQAKTIRWNLTANAARPNPQGSFHYGMINVTRTLLLYGSAPIIGGQQRYAVNGLSYLAPDTPLKLADYFGIPGVFTPGSMPDGPPAAGSAARLATAVVAADFRSFVELVFQNNKPVVNSWHIDGYSFFVVGMDGGVWTPNNRRQYNLVDAISRSTVQVYPQSWTAVLLELDNVGMWNVRSQIWERAYGGQQFYMRVFSQEMSFRNEAPIPPNVLLCGRAAHLS